jgi:hypothetical protein
MKKLLFTLAAISMAYWQPLAAAEQRYQAVPLSDGSDLGPEKIVILDTTAGHLWVWTESPATPSSSGGRYLIYQGQLRPGAKMGDIIQKQEWGRGK